jgi:hypothetical protein
MCGEGESAQARLAPLKLEGRSNRVRKEGELGCAPWVEAMKERSLSFYTLGGLKPEGKLLAGFREHF